MKAMNSSKKSTTVNQYEEIMKKANKKADNSLKIKSVNWRDGENFEIFTLFKNIPSGSTSTDSCLISSNA